MPFSMPPLIFATLVFSIYYGIYYFDNVLIVVPISTKELASLESLELKSILRLLFYELLTEILSGLIDYYLNSALEAVSVY